MAIFFQSRRNPPPPAPDESTLNVPLRTYDFEAFGKASKVTYLAPNGDAQAARYEKEVADAVSNLEGRLSRKKQGSLINQINAAAGKAWVTIDQEMEGFLKLCDNVPFITQGALDPSIYPVLNLWENCNEDTGLPLLEEIAQTRALVGWSRFQRAPGKVYLPTVGMGLDAGAVAPGIAADTVAQLAGANAIPGVLAQIGSVYRSLGQPPGKSAWAVPIEDPKTAASSWTTLEVFGRAVAVAGGGKDVLTIGDRKFAPIIDPKTGWPVANGTLQVVVAAPSAIQAGVIATTAFILGLPKGIDYIESFPNCEGAIVTTATKGQTRGFLELTAR